MVKSIKRKMDANQFFLKFGQSMMNSQETSMAFR